jgi:predicted TIM-barrel fold metal-dependent hydrolase
MTRRRGPVIDAHCHAGIGDLLGGDGDDDRALRRYERRAGDAGIDGAVLFAPLTADHRRANARVARIARRRPDRYRWFILVHPDKDWGSVFTLVDRAARQACCGIKVHWSDGVMTGEIAAAAQRRRMPVIYDPRGDVDRVAAFAAAYPDVAWIIPHLSSFADDWRAQVALVDLLERRPNVFADTAGVRYFDVLADAVRRAGATKVLFGSDGPLLHPGVELAKIDALDLTPSDTALVAGGNILRLIRRARRAVRPRPSLSSVAAPAR